MNWKTIEVEFVDGGVALVTLNRPDVLNAVDETMRLEFTALIPVLQAILDGSHDPALADHPDLAYDDAAEVLLLLEDLRQREGQAG